MLLKAAKKLVDDGRLPNIHCLFVGEGPDKEMLLGLIAELSLEKNATIFVRLASSRACFAGPYWTVVATRPAGFHEGAVLRV